MSEDIKKVPEELNDDDLGFVAGGKYSFKEWKAMTSEERAAATIRSQEARIRKQPCELD